MELTAKLTMVTAIVSFGFLAAVIARLSVADATQAFVRGLEDMVVAALVVGFAKGIEVVLADGSLVTVPSDARLIFSIFACASRSLASQWRFRAAPRS